MRRLYFDNLKIRNKLLLIYLFCVLFPIILTDAYILYNVSEDIRENHQRELQSSVARVEYNLEETVDRCFLFTSNLYTDQLLDDFLNEQYTSYTDYYENYMKMQRSNNLSYNYNYGLLNKIQIFSDNNTMINGGKIASIDMVRDMPWYQAFKDSGRDTFLYTYYDDAKKNLPGSGPCRTISIIRKLDNFGDYGIEKFIKIDIDYNVMLKDVQNEIVDAEIYVRNSEYVLFSNLPNTSGMKIYPAADSIKEEDITLSRKFSLGAQEWEVVILSQETPFMEAIYQNKGLLALILLNFLIPTLLIYFVGKSISSRLHIISAYIGKVEKEQFEVISMKEGEDEIGKLIRSFNMMVIKIKDLIEVVFKGNAEKQALELSKKQAELKAIQSQVNPHFLFNTLESIRMRSLIKNENETADIIGELAVLFRKSMSWGSDYIPIEEEMSFIENYINIQKYRFGDKIKFYHYMMEGCREYKVPKLSISSFIENACIHGIEETDGEGVITLNITKNKNHLYIEISDNGKGFEEERIKEIRWMIANADTRMLNESKSTGILNAFLRLKMYCDGDISFDIDSSQEKGTDITIRMPIAQMKNRVENDTKHKGEVISGD